MFVSVSSHRSNPPIFLAKKRIRRQSSISDPSRKPSDVRDDGTGEARRGGFSSWPVGSCFWCGVDVRTRHKVGEKQGATFLLQGRAKAKGKLGRTCLAGDAFGGRTPRVRTDGVE